jgi:hypothetical protein
MPKLLHVLFAQPCASEVIVQLYVPFAPTDCVANGEAVGWPVVPVVFAHVPPAVAQAVDG